MLLTSNGPTRVLALVAIAIALAPFDAPAQEPSLTDVMRRAHEFVVGYEDDLSLVVAEEHYEQQVLSKDGVVEEQRVLVSDYRVTQLLPHEFWFGVREVFEVDGRVVRERTTRPLRALRLSPGEDASERLRRIAEENASFNIGDVTRTFNEPTFVLSFLHPGNRDRMHFVELGTERVGELLAWVVGYREALVDGVMFQDISRSCTAPGFLDSGLTVFASTPPRPARGGRVAPGPGFGSRTSPASTARCTSA